MTNFNILVIYDADPDGFGSAYAAWKMFKDKADYLEVMHGNDLPKEAFNYNTVYIFDLSFPAIDLNKLRMQDIKVKVIDHHESSKDMIERNNFNPNNWPVDTTRAACVQVWEYFHNVPAGFGKTPPLILKYIADRDVWAWRLKYSEQINAYIYANFEKDFEKFDGLTKNIQSNPGLIAEYGEHIIRYRDRLVTDMVQDVTFIEYKDSSVPYVVAPVLHSEVGHRLLEMYPDAPFSMTSSEDSKNQRRKYSLRSEDDREDVGRIAIANGGGGHRNAAGFYKSFEDIWAAQSDGLLLKVARCQS